MSARDRAGFIRAVEEACKGPLNQKIADRLASDLERHIAMYRLWKDAASGPTPMQIRATLQRISSAMSRLLNELESIDDATAQLILLEGPEMLLDLLDCDLATDCLSDKFSDLWRLSELVQAAARRADRPREETADINAPYLPTRLDRGWNPLQDLLKLVAVDLKLVTGLSPRCYADRNADAHDEYAGNFIGIAEEVARIVGEIDRKSIGKLAQKAASYARAQEPLNLSDLPD